MAEEKRGTVTDIIFKNAENGYTIALVESEAETLTVVGCMPTVQRGGTYQFTGAWKTHASYGEQFDVATVEELMPEGAGAIELFLKSGNIKGIGPKTAGLIVKKFGEETLYIMEHTPQRLSEIDGIGPKKAASIGEAFKSKKEFAEISVFLQKFGVSAAYAFRLYKEYGNDTVEIVTENPYRMVSELHGFGFRKADDIAINMGRDKDDIFRIKSGIKYTLSYFVAEGNTQLPQSVLCEKTAELLDISTEQIYEALVELTFEGDVHMEVLDGVKVASLMAYFMAEQNVSRRLMELNDTPVKHLMADTDQLIKLMEGKKEMSLSNQQRSAVKNSLMGGVSVITGGPGTGKTTIINTIVTILTENGMEVAVAAPTGRAAKRITETSGYYASTIHRLLEYYYSEDKDTMEFGKNQENQLEYDAVIIDETSMVDILLMNGLLNAISYGTRLILVGDADQLPSVGAGNVLRDIIASEAIYCTKLTEIFRQAEESLIVVNAHKINKGEYPVFNEKNKDFFFIQEKSEKDTLGTVIDLCKRRLPAYFKDVDYLRDIQVLSPVRKGVIGSVNLNIELQAVLNPPSEELPEQKYGDKLFRKGDKVMQIKNNYSLEWQKTDDFSTGQGVFNGDVGFITNIDKEYGKVVVVFDDKQVMYEIDQLSELELAYALTVHKSQGSEFPVIVMPMSWFPPILATRNLLYTAVTRGKGAVVLVGSPARMQDMVDNNSIIFRYTGLKARLQLAEGVR